MIKLEHTVTASPEQMIFVIEGMRNPMNSWGSSDSRIPVCDEDCKNCFVTHCSIRPERDGHGVDDFVLGPNDLARMIRLSTSGTDHRKFMRMMPVYVRVTAPLYWWKEFDTYKVGTVRNSCSTMHKITAKEFDITDFSCEHMISDSKMLLHDTIDILNDYRSYYRLWEELQETVKIENEWKEKKDIWWQMIQLLPSSYNQTANVMMNYEVLANIYKSRKDHKLDEWREFCKWIEELPYSELITGYSSEDKDAE